MHSMVHLWFQSCNVEIPTEHIFSVNTRPILSASVFNFVYHLLIFLNIIVSNIIFASKTFINILNEISCWYDCCSMWKYYAVYLYFKFRMFISNIFVKFSCLESIVVVDLGEPKINTKIDIWQAPVLRVTTVYSYRQIAAEWPNSVRRNCTRTKVNPIVWQSRTVACIVNALTIVYHFFSPGMPRTELAIYI